VYTSFNYLSNVAGKGYKKGVCGLYGSLLTTLCTSAGLPVLLGRAVQLWSPLHITHAYALTCRLTSVALFQVFLYSLAEQSRGELYSSAPFPVSFHPTITHRMAGKVSALAWRPGGDGVVTLGDSDGVLSQVGVLFRV
jgi:hypothetical protein